MTQRAIYPTGLGPDDIPLRLSPGILSHGHLFLTGITGSAGDGSMPTDPAAQFRAAFDKVGAILSGAGAGFGDVVELTSYHIDMATHFNAFEAVHGAYVVPPYPAWTAIEVAGLRRPGALVEIRVIARAP